MKRLESRILNEAFEFPIYFSFLDEQLAEAYEALKRFAGGRVHHNRSVVTSISSSEFEATITNMEL